MTHPRDKVFHAWIASRLKADGVWPDGRETREWRRARLTIGGPAVWYDRPWSYGHENGQIPCTVKRFLRARVTIELVDTAGGRHTVHVAVCNLRPN